jgi:hypothetical protein
MWFRFQNKAWTTNTSSLTSGTEYIVVVNITGNETEGVEAYCEDAIGNSSLATTNFTLNTNPYNIEPYVRNVNGSDDFSGSDDITCLSAGIEDTNSTTLGFNISWWVDDVNVYSETTTGSNATMLNSSVFEEGNYTGNNEVECRINATDSDDPNWAWNSSSAETPANSPPVCTASLNDTSPYLDDDLQCTASCTDDDNDTIYILYNWFGFNEQYVNNDYRSGWTTSVTDDANLWGWSDPDWLDANTTNAVGENVTCSAVGNDCGQCNTNYTDTKIYEASLGDVYIEQVTANESTIFVLGKESGVGVDTVFFYRPQDFNNTNGTVDYYNSVTSGAPTVFDRLARVFVVSPDGQYFYYEGVNKAGGVCYYHLSRKYHWSNATATDVTWDCSKTTGYTGGGVYVKDHYLGEPNVCFSIVSGYENMSRCYYDGNWTYSGVSLNSNQKYANYINITDEFLEVYHISAHHKVRVLYGNSSDKGNYAKGITLLNSSGYNTVASSSYTYASWAYWSKKFYSSTASGRNITTLDIDNGDVCSTYGGDCPGNHNSTEAFATNATIIAPEVDCYVNPATSQSSIFYTTPTGYDYRNPYWSGVNATGQTWTQSILLCNASANATGNISFSRFSDAWTGIYLSISDDADITHATNITYGSGPTYSVSVPSTNNPYWLFAKFNGAFGGNYTDEWLEWDDA